MSFQLFNMQFLILSFYKHKMCVAEVVSITSMWCRNENGAGINLQQTNLLSLIGRKYKFSDQLQILTCICKSEISDRLKMKIL